MIMPVLRTSAIVEKTGPPTLTVGLLQLGPSGLSIIQPHITGDLTPGLLQLGRSGLSIIQSHITRDLTVGLFHLGRSRLTPNPITTSRMQLFYIASPVIISSWRENT
jgi:hypothetical protein